MPITRTPIIDDDGTGTTGTVIDNAWKQEFYNQIDALTAGSTPVYSQSTLYDASGNFGTLGQVLYAKVGRIVFLWAQPIYPVNSNTGNAVLGGLPWACSSIMHGGVYQVLGGLQSQYWIAAAATTIAILTPAGVARKNSELSGANFVIGGFYFTD